MNDGQRQTVPENSLQGRMPSVPAVNVLANVDTREKPQVVTGGSEGGGCYIVCVCVCVCVFPCVFVAFLVCRVDTFNVVVFHGDMDRDCVIASLRHRQSYTLYHQRSFRPTKESDIEKIDELFVGSFQM
jgi:hypothetical protein